MLQQSSGYLFPENNLRQRDVRFRDPHQRHGPAMLRAQSQSVSHGIRCLSKSTARPTSKTQVFAEEHLAGIPGAPAPPGSRDGVRRRQWPNGRGKTKQTKALCQGNVEMYQVLIDALAFLKSKSPARHIQDKNGSQINGISPHQGNAASSFCTLRAPAPPLRRAAGAPVTPANF